MTKNSDDFCNGGQNNGNGQRSRRFVNDLMGKMYL